ncbi:MAG: hypothetical protein WA749_16095 [Gelidibacter sp.]
MNSKLAMNIIASIGLLLAFECFFINDLYTSGDLDVNIEKAVFIMPAAHRVFDHMKIP